MNDVRVIVNRSNKVLVTDLRPGNIVYYNEGIYYIAVMGMVEGIRRIQLVRLDDGTLYTNPSGSVTVLPSGSRVELSVGR